MRAITETKKAKIEVRQLYLSKPPCLPNYLFPFEVLRLRQRSITDTSTLVLRVYITKS